MHLSCVSAPISSFHHNDDYILIQSPGAVISGSSIPGQGYVYVKPPNVNITTLEVFFYNRGLTWTQFQTYAEVACKMAGYNGTYSPSLFGFYENQSLGIMVTLMIRDCKDNENSFFDCSHRSSPLQVQFAYKYGLKVNCLRPGRCPAMNMIWFR